MSTLAIIPARGGSKGVPGKNIRPLGGHPLLAWSIAAARLCRNIDRVLVSTDAPEVREAALAYGAEAPFLRPARYARDTSPDSEFMVHCLDWLREHEDTVPELLVHLRPTTPLREPRLVDEAIAALRDAPDKSSLRSAHEASESPAKWFSLRDDGCFTGLLGDAWLDLPRQRCPKAYVPNGYVDVLRCERILSKDGLYGPAMLGFVTPCVSEVDTLDDLAYLEYEIGKGHPLLLTLQSLCDLGKNNDKL